jgi:hypothetical protein
MMHRRFDLDPWQSLRHVGFPVQRYEHHIHSTLSLKMQVDQNEKKKFKKCKYAPKLFILGYIE